MASIWRVTLVALLGLSVVAFRPLLAGEKSTDLEKIQGRWRLVDVSVSDLKPAKGFAKHTTEFKGNRIIVVHDNAREVPEDCGPFTLEPQLDPKWIDFRTGSGKDAINRIGIYDLNGDKLRICFSGIPAEEEPPRPSNFKTPPGAGRILFIYERVKK